MGGEIELTSELDKGSKFHITLDLRRAEEIEEMKLPSWRLLVVDVMSFCAPVQFPA